MGRTLPALFLASVMLSACSGSASAPYSPLPASPLQHSAPLNASQREPSGGQFSLIHSFSGGQDGSYPWAGLTPDSAGNLYGTTWGGGNGYGNIFKLKRAGSGWTVTSLYAFHSSDGADPLSRVIFGPNGDLYGTTNIGGEYGGGVVYKLTPSVNPCTGTSCPWSLTVLHNFNPAADGHNLLGDVTFDAAGNMYGTAAAGGPDEMGTVWEVSRQGAFSVLYSFGEAGSQDAAFPQAGVIFGSDGNLYGTTNTGGAHNVGSVFELTRSGSSWTDTRLYDFQGGSDGANPYGGVVFDASGRIDGSTQLAGADGGGTLYRLTPSQGHWTFSLLHPFSGLAGPQDSTLVLDSAGNIYGTTYEDGTHGIGNVFKVTASGEYTDLYDFVSTTNGYYPVSNITFDTAGDLFGTASMGGGSDHGVVFEISSSDRRPRSKHTR